MSIEWLCLVRDRDLKQLVAKICKDVGLTWDGSEIRTSSEGDDRLIALIGAVPLTAEADLPEGLREAAPNAGLIVNVVVATREDREMSALWELVNGVVHRLDGAIFDREEVRRGRPAVRERRKPPATNDAHEYGRLLRQAKAPSRPYQSNVAYTIGEVVEHPKFGYGVVTRIQHQRISVLFSDGPRTLVAGSAQSNR
jgi:hypothetical protein